MTSNISENEILLWEQWNPESLGKYIGKWIAFSHGRVVDCDAKPESLRRRFTEQTEIGKGPIFAYVTFEERA